MKNDKIITKSSKRTILLFKYGAVLLVQYITIFSITYFVFKNLLSGYFNDWYLFSNFEAQLRSEWVEYLQFLNFEQFFTWTMFIIFSLIFLLKKMDISLSIMNHPMFKKISKLHMHVINKVAEESEKRRVEGKTFTWKEIDNFVRNTLYINDSKIFVEVFKLVEFPTKAPYKSIRELLNFLSPELKKFQIG